MRHHLCVTLVTSHPEKWLGHRLLAMLEELQEPGYNESQQLLKLYQEAIDISFPAAPKVGLQYMIKD